MSIPQKFQTYITTKKHKTSFPKKHCSNPWSPEYFARCSGQDDTFSPDSWSTIYWNLIWLESPVLTHFDSEPFLYESLRLLCGGKGLIPLNHIFIGRCTNSHSPTPLNAGAITSGHLECVEGLSSLDSSCPTAVRASHWTVKIKTYLYISKRRVSASCKYHVSLILSSLVSIFCFP